MDLLLKSGNIIDENGNITLKMDILIKDGKIAGIGSFDNPEDAEIIDCTGKFVTPGFASMHNHSPMNIFKGIAEDVNIDDWFNEVIWPYESKMQDEDIYWGSKLARAEMVNNGITAFADHYFKSDLIAKACKEVGIRTDIAYTIFGFGGNCDRELELAEKFYNEFKDDEMIAPRMGPHSPYICSPEILRQIVEKAKELGCGVHLHVSETDVQVRNSKNDHNGKTPFQVAREAGCFEVPCIVGHGLWIEDGDEKYVRDDTVFAVSPKTYMKLGMYKGGLWDMREHLNLAAGNDGSASSNSIDVLEQVRLFALFGKWDDKAEDFTLKEVWKMLFSGHRFMKFGAGLIKEGAAADLNIFDLDTVHTAPVYDPLAAIIYSAVPAVNITDVMINGKFVKRGGKLAFDDKEIIENAQRCARGIYERGKGQAQIFF